MRRTLFALSVVLAPLPALADPDLSGTVPVLDETFATGLNRYDGTSGLWSTIGRRGQLMTNASQAVFLDHGVLSQAADEILPPLHVMTDDGLSLRSAALPPEVLPELRDYMNKTGQGKFADQILYGTAKITTANTWSQTYGYFEIEARVPRGRGRWPAFWLTSAGMTWPPEIDVMEAYGDGLDLPTPKDGTFNTAVFFDALDADNKPTLKVDTDNPLSETEEGRTAKEKKRGNRSIYNFHQLNHAARDLDADIYGEFNTYAALWTPETITFYFGKTRDTLKEIYRTPTPEDLQSPMILIANDQFTARGGILAPRKNALDRVLDPENDFRIRRITMRALEPSLKLDMATGDAAFDDRDSVISDTAADDIVAPGQGFDLIHLTGGRDQIRLSRGRDQKIISGFGPDDSVEFEGYPFADAQDAYRRLTQVGEDVWLPSGADPAWPQTVVFRDTTVDRFRPEQFRVRWSVGPNMWIGQADRENRPTLDDDGDGVLQSDIDSAWFNDKGKPVRMVGTPGPDRFMIANKRSTIESSADAGLDMLISWISLDLPDHIHHAVARGRGPEIKGSDGDDRLETEADNATLSGGAGDDLYVIAPSAGPTVIRIASGDGHDRVRGLKSDDSVRLDARLHAGRDGWRISEQPQGLLVEFSDDQSLLLEKMTPEAFLTMIGAD